MTERRDRADQPVTSIHGEGNGDLPHTDPSPCTQCWDVVRCEKHR